MDFNEYKDIAPYRGKDFTDAIVRLKANASTLRSMIVPFSGNTKDIKGQRIAKLFDEMEKRLDKVHNYDEFQKEITAGLFLTALEEDTTAGITCSGLDKLDPRGAYFFISNHRDIILDCALIDLELLRAGFGMCEMAIGDNLLYNQFFTDVFKLNGGVTVKRTLPLREKYLESIRLSRYFVDLITEEKHSIWCAQKSGRSKDGNDVTSPAIIKMLYLSKRGTGVKFPDLIRSCHIVPVAVSYELDPNDINKGRELDDISRNGTHEKKRYEDMISMIRGVTKYKGHIHISFGTEITDDCDSPVSVADQIDRQIHLSYRLWPTNLFAYCYLEGSDRFRADLEGFDSEGFLSRYENLRPEVRSVVLNGFANPVRNYLRDSGQED